MERSVAEYAEEAGISERRVRKLAESGQIAARKYGSSWVISEPSVIYASHRQGSGRPLGEAAAWDLALMLDGYMSSSQRRARTRARAILLRSFEGEQGYDPQVEKLAMRWLNARATTKYFRAVAGDMNDIRNDPRLQATGVSHPKSGLLQADEFEAYVLRSDYVQVVDDYMLIDTARARTNVTLRVIDATEIPRVIPRLIIAVDLLERGTTREVSAGQHLLEEVM